MKHQRPQRQADLRRETTVRSASSFSAITSRYAALRREQIVAARRLAAAEAARDPQPSARCRIAVARDRKSPFVYRPPRPGR